MPAKIDWDKIRSKLPFKRTPEEKKKRIELFHLFDPNSNGYLSLAECDKGCRDILGLYEVFDCKPVIMRAFQGARVLNDGKEKEKAKAKPAPKAPTTHGHDYIEFCEFRMFLWYLRQYFELWQMFSEIDASDDHRIEYAEFVKALPRLGHWGAKVTDPQAAFKEIDRDGGGMILFDEFAHWALSKHLDLSDDDDYE